MPTRTKMGPTDDIDHVHENFSHIALFELLLSSSDVNYVNKRMLRDYPVYENYVLHHLPLVFFTNWRSEIFWEELPRPKRVEWPFDAELPDGLKKNEACRVEPRWVLQVISIVYTKILAIFHYLSSSDVDCKSLNDNYVNKRMLSDHPVHGNHVLRCLPLVFLTKWWSEITWKEQSWSQTSRMTLWHSAARRYSTFCIHINAIDLKICISCKNTDLILLSPLKNLNITDQSVHLRALLWCELLCTKTGKCPLMGKKASTYFQNQFKNHSWVLFYSLMGETYLCNTVLTFLWSVRGPKSLAFDAINIRYI